MKVKKLMDILKTVDGNEEICIADDSDYVSLREENIQRIYKKNGYQGLLLNPTRKKFFGTTSLIKKINDALQNRSYEKSTQPNLRRNC